MSGLPGYYTLGAPGHEELVIKKSRFIGQAAPVNTEEEALAFIKSVKESNKTASHNCFAYIIGANAGLMRYQDDGEPQGTAGIPILEVLKRNQLVNCAAVVTRYFGGVLLGAGGLTRAYSAATAAAVKAAGIVIAESTRRLSAQVGYAHWDAMNYALGRLPVCQVEKEFTDKVGLRLLVRAREAEQLLEELATLSDGSADVALSDPFFHLWDVEAQEEQAE